MGTVKTTDGQFNEDVIKSSVPVLVDFWAEWCGPCRSLGPKLEDISNELGDKLKVAKVNVDENQSTPSTYGVRGIPTMILFKDGEVVEQMVGNYPKEQILDLINKHI